MTIWWLAVLVGSFALVVVGFTWVFITFRRMQRVDAAKNDKSVTDLNKAYTEIAEEDATHLFNKEFREELKNRGRMRFEKIIDENAMFLKQDLDMTIAQLNDYMKQEISSKLDSEFSAYAKAMKEAQELALSSLQHATADVEQQRTAMAESLKTRVAEREANMLKAYEENMAKIIEHYVLQALGDQFELKAQLPYIIAQMEANKQNIMEDMRL